MVIGQTLQTAPAAEPVTLTEAKAYAQIEHTDDDTLITSLIVAARELLEQATWRQLVTATWDLTLEDWPTGSSQLDLPFGQVQSITSVTYTDSDGASQTLASSVYALDNTREPAGFFLDYGQEWPAVRDERNAITIRIVAGYGAAAAVPDLLKTALKMTVKHWYESGGECGDLPAAAMHIAARYRFDFEA